LLASSAQLLNEIDLEIVEISGQYFTNLPESAIEVGDAFRMTPNSKTQILQNSDHISVDFGGNSRSFELTSLTDSPVSVAVRKANF
jgi:hypothetical protein